MKQRQFSSELQAWATKAAPKTLGSLIESFSRDAFAILILFLMSIPALPVPTGGLTHLFEIVTMLLALELIIGRTTIWLPKRWQAKSLAGFSKGKALPKLLTIIRAIERISRPRAVRLFNSPHMVSVMGLFILVFALAAFLAPPFSGLDTLPSLGVVLLALSLIFSDIALFFSGVAIGIVGIGLLVILGSVIYKLF